MNARERILAVCSQSTPDRVPIYPKISFATTLACPEVRLRDYRNSSESMARASIAAYRFFGWDGIAMHTSIAWSGIALGSSYDDPEDDLPRRTVCLIPTLGDPAMLERIVVRDPAAIPVTSTVIGAVSIAKREVGAETCIMAWVDGPLNICSQLCPLDELLIGLIEEPEFCHAMFQRCLELSKAYATALIRAGADFIAIGHATASSSVISRDAYQEFALPYETELVAWIHSMGAMAVTHICGSIRGIADLIAANGSDILDFDSVNNLSELIRIAPGKVFRGNISPSLLSAGTPGQVEAAVESLLNAAPEYHGYILGSGCEINLNTPVENIQAMVRAGKRYGVRP